jgi:hypothetical protein
MFFSRDFELNMMSHLDSKAVAKIKAVITSAAAGTWTWQPALPT